jgi:hypothetical protein
MVWESISIENARNWDNQARALFRLFMQSVAVITVTSPWKEVSVALVPPSA